jgi:hypothetical protein
VLPVVALLANLLPLLDDLYGQLRKKKTASPLRNAACDSSSLFLLVLGHGFWGDAVGDHAVLGREARDGLGAVYDDLGRIFGIEDVAPVGPDVLEAVAHPALVLGAL